MITALLLQLAAIAPHPELDLRGSRKFENEITTSTCRELFFNNRSLGWIAGGRLHTSIGVVVRLCEAEKSEALATDAPVVSGWTKPGLFAFDPTTGVITEIVLPNLNDFSNAHFCGNFAAYWGADMAGVWSLVVADLTTKAVVAHMQVGALGLETDDIHFLNHAEWDSQCTQATFRDGRFIKDTILRSRPNQPLHPTPTAAEAPASGAGEHRR